MTPIEHKHLIIRAEVENPPKDIEGAKDWLRTLVKKIGMKLLDVEGNPIAGYVNTPGNRGLTIAGIIETSHIAMHVWDESDPALVQLDVYTCSTLDPTIVYEQLDEFSCLSRSTKLLDREKGLIEIL